MKQLYYWLVSHPAHEDVEVQAVDRLTAIVAAAASWRERWTLICKDCETARLRRVRGKQ